MKIKLSFFISILLLIFCISSCNKNDIVPSVSYMEITNSTPYTLVLSALIVSEGSAAISEEGFCINKYDNIQTPEYGNCDTLLVVSMNNNREFTDTINGLFPNTKYRICAFARNSAGIGYSETIIATTNQ